MLHSKEYYDHVYQLSYTTRYNSTPRIRSENVAEHSFHVAAIILDLHDKYDFNLGLALQAAICHDILEADLGDVIHPVLKRWPEIRRTYEDASKEEILKYPRAVQFGWKLYNGYYGNHYAEYLIARLADIIQVKQYAESEIQNGNNYMSRVVTEARSRSTKLKEKLHEYRRNTERTNERLR